MMLVLGLIAALALVPLALLIRSRALAAFDVRTLALVRGLFPSGDSAGHRKLWTTMRDVTALGGDLVSGLVMASGIAILAHNADYAGLGFFAALMGGTRLAGWILKKFIARERPPSSDHALDIFTSSFPSVHTAMGFVSSFAIAQFLVAGDVTAAAALGIGALVSALIGLTRMFFAVHWPLDVLAGWLLGLSACSLAIHWLQA